MGNDEVANIGDNNFDLPSSSKSFSNIELVINNIVDLTVNVNIDDFNEEKDFDTAPNTISKDDLIYNSNYVLNGFLEHERRVAVYL